MVFGTWEGVSRRMKNIFKIAFWLLPAMLAVAWHYASETIEHNIELIRAELTLVNGDDTAARATFKRIAPSLFNGARARFGLAVCRALDGGEIDPGLEPPEPVTFSLSLLMSHELRSAHFERCLNLARFGHVLGEPTAALYESAALLELADHGFADAWAEVQPTMRATALGRRVAGIAALVDQGAIAVVRDRAGEIIGSFDSTGAFLIDPHVDPALIPATLLHEIGPPPDHKGIHLALDLDLSRIARSALEGYRGSIVLINPGRGEVLAAVSDSVTLEREGGTPAFDQRLEPASIQKVITLVAALRAGIDPDEEISRMKCTGAARYEGGILYCPYPAGPLQSLNRAMAISCNIAFAELGVEVGWHGMLTEMRRWGFDSEAGNPFPLGRVTIPAGSELDLANLSIGLNTSELTPAHAALIAAAVCNDGVMPHPTLFRARDGLLGMSQTLLQPEVGTRVVEREWIDTVWRSMLAVTWRGGTAAGVAPLDFPVAMKTGTGSSISHRFHVNYIGFGPWPNPKIAFAVRVTNQRTSPRVRHAAFEVTKRLLRGLRDVAYEKGLR